jgi:hypothetical protein
VKARSREYLDAARRRLIAAVEAMLEGPAST